MKSPFDRIRNQLREQLGEDPLGKLRGQFGDDPVERAREMARGLARDLEPGIAAAREKVTEAARAVSDGVQGAVDRASAALGAEPESPRVELESGSHAGESDSDQAPAKATAQVHAPHSAVASPSEDQVERVLEWYEKDPGTALIGDEPLAGIKLEGLVELFQPGGDDPLMHLVYEVAPREVNRLQRAVQHPIDLEAYDYFVAAYRIGDPHSAALPDGVLPNTKVRETTADAESGAVGPRGLQNDGNEGSGAPVRTGSGLEPRTVADQEAAANREAAAGSLHRAGPSSLDDRKSPVRDPNALRTSTADPSDRPSSAPAPPLAAEPADTSMTHPPAVTVQIGVDLGTTFSCVAYLHDGRPHVALNRHGSPTTPSVLCFDGAKAWVGEEAYEAAATRPGQLFAFVKRDAGRPAEAAPGGEDRSTAPYVSGGFRWGVVGMQAVLLRALKLDAIAHLRDAGALPPGADEGSVIVEAVVTVPAYFKDLERLQTQQAARCAGLRLRRLVNEPTAAALTYRLVQSGSRRILVFDLGGGTFDVTVVELQADGQARVLASDGNRQLGGKDFDDSLFHYLKDRYEGANRRELPEGREEELRRAATRAKLALSDEEVTHVVLDWGPDGRLDAALHRSPPAGYNAYDDTDDTFYFEERASGLFAQIESLCISALNQVPFEPIPGSPRPMTWADLDEVVMVGGSCRMPIVARMLARLTGKPIREHPEGFDLDTAVAIGAAIYADQAGTVQDIAAGGVGVKAGRRGPDGQPVFFVEPLIRKNDPLPASASKTFQPSPNAVVDVYQGESARLDECDHRGRLRLGTPAGPVTVGLHLDVDGHLTASATFASAPGATPERRELPIDAAGFDAPTAELYRRVRAVDLNPGPP